MLLIITLILFCFFILFQTLYIFIPLYTSRTKERVYPIKENGISILIPAYNESLVIENCLLGLLNVNYHNFEVLFINDGSVDDTLEKLNKQLLLVKTPRAKQGILNHETVKGVYRSQIYPHIWIIDKENGGKADSLNTGIDYAKEEIVITLDADSILESNALNEINLSFIDESIVAAGGLVNIVQGFKRNGTNLVPCFKVPGIIRFQVVRYLTGFYMNKVTQSKFGSLTVIAGAFGAFRRSILIQANGYRKTVGEDMDITLRIQELIGTSLKGKRIIFVPEAVCYTECPASLKSLYRQRIRWQKAFIDCVITFRRSFFKKINFKTSVFLLLDSLLLGTLSAYTILFIPIIALIMMNHLRLLFFLFTISVVLAIMLNIATLLVSKRFGHLYNFGDYISLFLFLPLEVMFYRFTEVFFVTFGTILYFFNKDGWSRSERIGNQLIFEADLKAKIKNTLGG